MKHSNFLLTFADRLSNNIQKHPAVWVEGLSVYLLNLVVRTFDIPCFVVIQDGLFLNRNELFWGWSPKKHIQLFNDSLDVPGGFLSSFAVDLRSAQIAISGGLSDVALVCSDYSVAQKPLFSLTPNPGFFCNSLTQYNDLLVFLKKNYSRVDFIDRVGQFSSRGGVIDVFPFLSRSPVRVVFSFDVAEIYSFDLISQKNHSTLKSVSLGAIPDGDYNYSLFDVFKQQSCLFVVVSKGGVSFRQKVSKNIALDRSAYKLSPSFEALDYSDYVRISKNAHVFFSPLLLYGGYKSNQGACVFPLHYKKSVEKNPSPLSAKTLLNLDELSVGDYLVHAKFGVAQYVGIKTSSVASGAQDWLLLKYKNGAKVSVDVSHLDLISFYAGGENRVSLDDISKPSLWNKKKARAKLAAEDFVVSLYRSHIKSSTLRKEPYRYSQELLKNFVDSFVYTDTRDQRGAWLDIIKDLAGASPMNRVLCGDVGFGKTEIAMRAAFVAALSGVKCLVLCPTTLLANQHFHSFYGRLSPFGANVSLFSGLQSKKEIVAVTDSLYAGHTDVLISTHKVLFHEGLLGLFGLIVIDEEHRFGVKDKEKIKLFSFGVDMLYMSATPIPRTLHLGLIGFKGFSIIKTPPRLRLPVITNICYYNDLVIKKAIYNELSRGGQIYFIHNNIQTIDRVAFKIKSICPEGSVSVIHSKQNGRVIKKTMSSFINKRINILIATSIVESGLDIKNVNTIIINNAHLFGLSQLYQMRGRVGRSSVQSYAFLLVPKKTTYNETSVERLKIMEKNTSLGVGYEIAKKDLFLRGGGTVFGYKQSGATASVGYELYTKMVALGVQKRLLNNRSDTKKMVVVKNGCITQDYIGQADLRVAIYRQLGLCVSLEDVDRLASVVIDLFGAPPRAFSLLVLEYKIKIIIKQGSCVLSVVYYNDLKITLSLFGVNKKQVQRILSSLDNNITFSFKIYPDVFKLYLSRQNELCSFDWLTDIILKLVSL